MVTAIGLPLLMVNGKFQSLGSMTVEDLETFIPFLVKCSVNRAGAQLVNGVPEWWLSTIPYKFPLQKPSHLSQTGYKKHLSSVVCRCYWYHDAQYLLPFCAEIAKSPESIYLRSNEDNTTSIFYVHNTTHIMKFNNENKNYDMGPRNRKSHRRCLLPALPKKTTNIPDIYLCENCDAEFSSHSDMQKHEKQCYEVILDDCGGKIHNCSSSIKKRDSLHSQDEIEVLEHIKPVTDTSRKNTFLNYLALNPKSNRNSLRTSGLKKSLMEAHSKQWVNIDLCLHKNFNIEFSSPFGMKMLENSVKRDLMSRVQRTILTNESYCGTGVKMNKDGREKVEFKVTCKKHRKGNWVHQYCFNKKQRRSRYETLETGLDEHSRKLLKQCKELRIVLTRLRLTS